VLNISNIPDVFYAGVYDPVFVVKELRKIPAADIAILVDGRCKHCTTVLPVPSRIVGAPAKKGYAKRSTDNDHGS
jgi:hypothetical protein